MLCVVISRRLSRGFSSAAVAADQFSIKPLSAVASLVPMHQGCVCTKANTVGLPEYIPEDDVYCGSTQVHTRVWHIFWGYPTVYPSVTFTQGVPLYIQPSSVPGYRRVFHDLLNAPFAMHLLPPPPLNEGASSG